MKTTTIVAGLSTILFALAGIAWFALELVPPSLGFEDTDDPAVSVLFIREHPEVFIQAGLVLILMSIFLTIAVLAVADAAKRRAGGVALTSVSTFGLFSAAFFLVFGALRVGASGPLLHIAGLRDDWGETAYLVVQMAGVHGVGQAGVITLCLWAVGLSLIGLRTGVLPRALCVLGMLPAIRLVGVTLGPLGVLPDSDLLWPIFMAAIVGTMLWFLLLGIVLLRRSFGSAAALGLGVSADA